MVVWNDRPDADLGAVDRAAEMVTAVAGDQRYLTVLAGAATRWVWMHGRPEPELLRTRAAEVPDVRIAVGSTGDGVDGFRRGHLDALAVQRMLAWPSSPHQVAMYDEVELVTLLTAVPESAEHFVTRVLGELETTEAVRVFTAAQCNVSHAADRLYVHRNTLLHRLARADRLLPRPLAANVVEVAAHSQSCAGEPASDARPFVAPGVRQREARSAVNC